MWKNKKIGFAMQHRSFPIGEREGDSGRIEFQKKRFAAE